MRKTKFKILGKLAEIKFLAGETMMEVVVALFVVVMGSATAASLVVTSIKANVFNKDSLVALNLAQEGIEYMRNVRDSNFLKFSSNLAQCWNAIPGAISCPTSKISAGTYFLGKDLGKSSNVLDLTNGIDLQDKTYLLNYYDVDTAVDSGGDGKKDNDKDLISNNEIVPPYLIVGETKFYRQIIVDYKILNGVGAGIGQVSGTAADQDSGNIMLITSKVVWLDGSKTHEVKLSSGLANYK